MDHRRQIVEETQKEEERKRPNQTVHRCYQTTKLRKNIQNGEVMYLDDSFYEVHLKVDPERVDSLDFFLHKIIIVNSFDLVVQLWDSYLHSDHISKLVRNSKNALCDVLINFRCISLRSH